MSEILVVKCQKYAKDDEFVRNIHNNLVCQRKDGIVVLPQCVDFVTVLQEDSNIELLGLKEEYPNGK